MILLSIFIFCSQAIVPAHAVGSAVFPDEGAHVASGDAAVPSQLTEPPNETPPPLDEQPEQSERGVFGSLTIQIELWDWTGESLYAGEPGDAFAIRITGPGGVFYHLTGPSSCFTYDANLTLGGYTLEYFCATSGYEFLGFRDGDVSASDNGVPIFDVHDVHIDASRTPVVTAVFQWTPAAFRFGYEEDGQMSFPVTPQGDGFLIAEADSPETDPEDKPGDTPEDNTEDDSEANPEDNPITDPEDVLGDDSIAGPEEQPADPNGEGLPPSRFEHALPPPQGLPEEDDPEVDPAAPSDSY